MYHAGGSMLSRWLSLVSGVAGTLLLVSCGGSTSTSPYGGGGGTPPASCASSGASATITATGSFTFSPSTATITAGQTGRWGNHTGTSPPGTSHNRRVTGRSPPSRAPGG